MELLRRNVEVIRRLHVALVANSLEDRIWQSATRLTIRRLQIADTSATCPVARIVVSPIKFSNVA